MDSGNYNYPSVKSGFNLEIDALNKGRYSNNYFSMGVDRRMIIWTINNIYCELYLVLGL